MKVCDLKKPCCICKKEFGRKLRSQRFAETRRYLETIAVFKKRNTCSHKCESILRAWDTHMKKAKHKIKKLAKEKALPILNDAFKSFIGV